MSQARRAADPLHVFRFRVDFSEASLSAGGAAGSSVPLGQGAFSECTGLEATMEPKVIKEGGRNYGAAQRAGPVTFGTVVLRRGLVRGRDLWSAFALVAKDGRYAYRLRVTVRLLDGSGDEVMAFQLDRAMPVKLKVADLNARATEVGIEELHLAHEGLTRL
ncbi:phage tail protein [Sorangium sp. So ce1389]|uniref:phage tail protein n=1 Tax=Sorangium sp. So ce1389 TaxID=3133336 RepID=UPI003F6257D1